MSRRDTIIGFLRWMEKEHEAEFCRDSYGGEYTPFGFGDDYVDRYLAERPDSASLSDLLDEMRAKGWTVAVHNDYVLSGVAMTFWLFTHPSGFFVRGEGDSDEMAIKLAAQSAAAAEFNVIRHLAKP